MKNAVKNIRARFGGWLLKQCSGMGAETLMRQCMREALDRATIAAQDSVDFDDIAQRIVDEVDSDDIAERVADNLNIDGDYVAERIAEDLSIENDDVADKAADKMFEVLDVEEMIERIAWKLADSDAFMDGIASRVLKAQEKRALEAQAKGGA